MKPPRARYTDDNGWEFDERAEEKYLDMMDERFERAYIEMWERGEFEKKEIKNDTPQHN